MRLTGARKQEGEAKAKGLTGAGQPFFIRPTKEEHFVRGSGLFWAHFEKEKKPYKENMAHPLSGIDFLTEKKHVMVDGLVEGDWTYHIDASGDITRTKGKDDKVETQWFAWQHEATVIKLDDRGNVVTFETSGGSRWTIRSLKSLTDPMSVDWIRKLQDDTNVFVGFAPRGRPCPSWTSRWRTFCRAETRIRSNCSNLPYGK